MGCPTKLNGYTASWTRGKLSSLTKGVPLTGKETYNYSYNAYGQRTERSYLYSKTSSGLSQVAIGTLMGYTQVFRYDQLGRLVYESKSSEFKDELGRSERIVYLYDENGIIGIYTLNGSSSTYYFQRNLLGDVIGIYDTNGTKVAGYTYDAWGNCTVDSSTTNYYVAYANPIRYRGYYYDEDTGLYYLNARYYNPQWRRFISPDDTAYLDPETPNGLNLYAYCYNDPVNYVDPSGCLVETVLDVAFALWSLYDLIKDPSWKNAGWFALDLACLIIPYATGGSTAIKGIVKGVNGADNLLDAGKVPRYIMRNADDVVILGQNMDRVYDASRKIGGGIIYGGLDDFGEIVLKYGDDVANSMGYIDNMKWVAKQAWSGKTVLNIGLDISRLDDPIKYANSFKVCKGELFWYRTIMLGKFSAFWSHRIYRVIFGGF